MQLKDFHQHFVRISCKYTRKPGFSQEKTADFLPERTKNERRNPQVRMHKKPSYPAEKTTENGEKSSKNRFSLRDFA